MSTSLIILVLTVASFLLGFLRDLFIARSFGLSWQADLIFVSLILPLFFENFLALALRDAMIPYLQKLRSQSEELFQNVARWIYWRVLWAAIAITILIMAISYWIMHALAPGWSTEQIELGRLTFCVGSLLLAVQGALYCQSALLNMDKVFLLPMTRTVMLNAGAIIGILLFEPSGTVIFLGMLLPQLGLILVQHHRLNYVQLSHRAQAPAEAKGHGTEFIKVLAPMLLAAAAQQACILAERMFASFLAEGSITMLSFAYRIVTIPLTLYAMSVLTVLFPHFTESWNNNDHTAHNAAIRKGLLATLLFLVPAAVVLSAFPEAVVSVLLERGQFGPQQSEATSVLLIAYAISLPAAGMAMLWGRALLAQHQSRLFLIITLTSSAVTIALDALLYRPLGAQGLALSFSAGISLQALLMGIGIYWVTPQGLGLALLLRWGVAAVAIAATLHYLPEPHGLLDLCIYIPLVILSFAALLKILGEKDLFNRSYWSMKSA
ncbi:murein biosynthesis integral membrane protein MurJ [Azomonas macrocytogenes]|uniref:Murein biosynthesis integral membrane protein MurJ n=1 Tax=Azomonas macrocytogenes TaxID=69962 RepID=A0A839SWM1_AZOMA|nr:lipid II flippase MurJ [Azomonas macrocytogenes]MBB3101787.1 murein biosynthesis integral membrane protein MurJ [Azomonas macrocytogenes]